jgi:hypothetical protein
MGDWGEGHHWILKYQRTPSAGMYCSKCGVRMNFAPTFCLGDRQRQTEISQAPAGGKT